MSLIEREIQIALPPRKLFELLTTAARWPEWHPHSLWVSAEDRPLMPGARFEETARFAGRERQWRWIVRDLRPAMFWIAEAESADGLKQQLRYDLHSRGKGCLLVLRLDYQLPTLWQRVLDPLVLRRRIAREALDALQALHCAVEGNKKPGAI